MIKELRKVNLYEQKKKKTSKDEVKIKWYSPVLLLFGLVIIPGLTCHLLMEKGYEGNRCVKCSTGGNNTSGSNFYYNWMLYQAVSGKK